VIYGLFIQDSPSNGAAFHSAARFAAAALVRGHQIRQIFLYGDAVLAALHPQPSGIRGLDSLAELTRTHGIPLLACQAAMERLSIEGSRHPAIKAGSLGQWYDAVHDLDRIMSFCR
jgi:tRNA 2-thiouridine synthesizing protein D